jgi:NAD(P)-dependent dehydrogenase (short-subunit alcohol dehydrogenase family)
MADLSGRVAIITGAAGNLGQALSHAFMGAGARLVLVDRAGNEHFSTLYPHLEGSADAHFAGAVDLGDSVAVEAMVAEAIGRFGHVDILINAAGGYRGDKPTHEAPLDDWEVMFNMNLRTALVTSRALSPHMIERGRGKIVNVAARAALQGGARIAAYSASKAAVIRLTESMSAELKTSGINVNCVLPSTIDTPPNRQAMPRADTRKWVSPEALAEVILFLASDAARAIHGAAIPVYGIG